MKKILVLCSLCIGNLTIHAQINTRDMATDICNILTAETSVKKDIDGFQNTLGSATATVFDNNKDAINNFFVLNPKYNNAKSAHKWGQETGMELSHLLMCNCTIYQEVILNNGDELPAYNKITEEIGNSIEAKVKAKSKKKVLAFDKCKKIMYDEIKANRAKISTDYPNEIKYFVRELQLYLYTQTTYYSKAAVIQMRQNVK